MRGFFVSIRAKLRYTETMSIAAPTKQHEYVVILHGIFRTKRHMRKLNRYLESCGYHTLNLTYPSTRYPLETLRDITWQDMERQLPDTEAKVHFVGYSMGGLLVRTLLSHYRPKNLGRVVLLGTPNHGSEVADFLKNNWLYKKLYGPAGQQLITDQSTISHLFSPVDYECGILAGTCSLDPLCYFLFDSANDGKVSVESTKLDGTKDHLTIHATHTFFPHHPPVQHQTAAFLKNGRFLTL